MILPKHHIYFDIPKIDAHVHHNLNKSALFKAGEINGFRFLTINTEVPDFISIADQQKVALQVGRENPENLHFITTFATTNFKLSDFADQAISEIQNGLENGGVAVKIWKNIGMELQDDYGNFVMADDPIFDPIYEFLEKHNIPLAAHLGEPKNCWLPLNEMTVTSDRDYFSKNPKYHMYLHKEFPSYEKQLKARDRILEKHPNLTFIGLHLASLEWNVEKVANWLDSLPNSAVDLAERVCHLQHQAVENSEKVAQFIEQYQDRIIYGSDHIYSDESEPDDQVIESIQTKWQNEFRFFSDSDIQTAWNVKKPFPGLGLSEKVLKKVFHDNALRYYPKMGS